jgi:hypothetical protein
LRIESLEQRTMLSWSGGVGDLVVVAHPLDSGNPGDIHVGGFVSDALGAGGGGAGRAQGSGGSNGGIRVGGRASAAPSVVGVIEHRGGAHPLWTWIDGGKTASDD